LKSAAKHCIVRALSLTAFGLTDSGSLPMTILLATDVFGATPAMASIVRALGQDCEVVSPFDDPHLYFQEEKTAYYAFLAQGGVSRYADKLTHILKERGTDIRMAVGFSAGASALWIASASEAALRLQATILFYGSRIRDHKEVRPRCPVRLIFAENEAVFNAVDLCKELCSSGHQAELARGTRHGFMNPYSSGFDVNSQSTYLSQLASTAQALI
jgi:dienelactone hydrolase